MTFSKGLNATGATGTRLRLSGGECPYSGMCVTCLDGCVGLCEVGKSAVRAKEVLYPQPFGKITAASEKDYPVDYSHFNIMGTAVGAIGLEADSDKAIFPAVNLETTIGAGAEKVKLKVPFTIGAMGSTNVALNNWVELAAGCAISGVPLFIGENVVGMDPNSEFKNGRVVNSPGLDFRVKAFRDWFDGYATVVVQANVEDTMLGTQEYAIDKLGVDFVELKWGQGAKDIGGEVKLNTIERARQLKSRGYIVLPDPDDAVVEAAYKAGAFTEFERHSRVGMVTEESFHARVAELRKLGAKFVSLKTGAYRAADLARAIKFASDAKLDLLTIDGAGGGTGMSPWRMMNEWGIPTVYIQALAMQMLSKLAAKGRYIPTVSIAGGFTLEDQAFKGLAMGAPYFKLVTMSRSPLTAAMVGKNIGEMVKSGKVPNEYKKYGESIEQVFILAEDLKKRLGGKYGDLPVGAIGVYSYFERLAQGLRQFMAGARKFSLEYITRDDLVALTREGAEITGIPYIMDNDKEEVEKILG
ncbi:MAG: FMN-binding glutamate synthase family protein [Firmicutes bacterium]|nr:FMN-binding glutamate synthase family protein [Bacillota bacterium]